MTVVMNLTLQIPPIATDIALSFEEKTAQIRNLLRNHRAAGAVNENGHVLQANISRAEFFSDASYDEYMSNRGNLLVNAEGRCGWTILMSVAMTNATDIARWLVETQGARISTCNEFGVTPLHAAMQEGQIEMAATLIELGADVNQPTTRWAGDSSHGDTYPGETPLHFAVRYGRVDLIVMLLQRGANPNQKSIHINTPLEWAKKIRRHLIALAEEQELPDTGSILGSSRFRDMSKVPSLESIDAIIAILSTPSRLYLSSLKASKHEPGQLVSQASLKEQNAFKQLLVVTRKATKTLPKDAQDMINAFLFNIPERQGVTQKMVENHLAKLLGEGIYDDYVQKDIGPKELAAFKVNFTLFKKMEDEMLERRRHLSTADQSAYDKRFGLVVMKP